MVGNEEKIKENKDMFDKISIVLSFWQRGGEMRLAGMEAGGTKFVLAIGKENGEIIKRLEIPITTPEETMELVV